MASNRVEDWVAKISESRGTSAVAEALDTIPLDDLDIEETLSWYRLRGVAEYEARRFEQAIYYFRESVKRFPESGLIHFYLGRSLVAVWKCRDALPHLRKCTVSNVGAACYWDALQLAFVCRDYGFVRGGAEKLGELLCQMKSESPGTDLSEWPALGSAIRLGVLVQSLQTDETHCRHYARELAERFGVGETPVLDIEISVAYGGELSELVSVYEARSDELSLFFSAVLRGRVLGDLGELTEAWRLGWKGELLRLVETEVGDGDADWIRGGWPLSVGGDVVFACGFGRFYSDLLFELSST